MKENTITTTENNAVILEVKGLRKTFEDDIKVLRGIDFTLNKGEVLSIIGPSGSGKSTLLRCLNFLVTPDSGQIIVGDETLYDGGIEIDIDPEVDPDTTTDSISTNKQSKVKAKRRPKPKKESSEAIRKKRLHFGLVFQQFNLFPHLSIIRNITLASELIAKETLRAEKSLIKKQNKGKSNKEIKAMIATKKAELLGDINAKGLALLDRVGLSDKEKAYPCTLSGGQCQRVAIARALALNPDILCFDEPTSALDPELTGEVLKVIKGLKSGDSTMIVVTHEMEFAKNVSDKIIFMVDGRIEEMGTPEQVFENPQSEKTKSFLAKSNEDIFADEMCTEMQNSDVDTDTDTVTE